MGQFLIYDQGSARARSVYGLLQLHYPASTGPFHFPSFSLSGIGTAPIARRHVPSLDKLPIFSRPISSSHRPLRWRRNFELPHAGRAPPFLVSTAFISHACRPAAAPYLSGFCCFPLNAAWWRSGYAGTIRSPSVDHRAAGISVEHSA